MYVAQAKRCDSRRTDSSASPTPTIRLAADVACPDPDSEDADLRAEVEGLRRRLLTQPTIDQAKGILIALYGLDADRAFAVLVRWSQETNTKLHRVAGVLVETACHPADEPSAELRYLLSHLPGQVAALMQGPRDGEHSTPAKPAG